MIDADANAENAKLRERVRELEDRLHEAESTLHAIRTGDVDALVVERQDEAEVYSIATADRFYFQLAQQAASIGAFDWDPVRQRLYWSEGIFQILGVDSKTTEPTEEMFWHAVHPDDRDRLRAKLDALFASDAVDFYDEFQICRDDGSCRWVTSKGRVLRNADGTPRRFVGVNIDITERKRIEEALTESESLFREMADAMPQMVWTARPDGHTDYYNERWYEFTGYPRERFGDESFTPLLHPDDVGRCLEMWYASVRTGTEYVIEYRFWCRKTNAYRWYLTRALPIRGRDGRIIRWIGTCTDVHDMKLAQEALTRSEDALREADRRKDEFLAMLAHELRNPMAPIQTGLDLLTLELPQPNQTVAIMREQFGHLVRLVDDLLDVSRIMRGRVELKKEPAELAALVHRAVATVQPWVDSRRQRLVVAVPERPVYSKVDSVRVLQVLTNLLNNASKYSDPKSQIDVTLSVSDDRAQFSVRDRGIGIEPEFLPHVFDLFSQASRSLDRAEGGLGIGLTLVKNLVQLHGGRVEARSEGPKRGSEFLVYLPLVAAGDAAEESRPPRANSMRRRILVVDDNMMNTALTSRLLKTIGDHEVKIANDGETALQIAAEFRPEIVLLDIGLPGMDGYALARLLRNTDHGRNTLLAAVTGYGQPADRVKSNEAGFDLHLIKPTSLAMLEMVLADPRLSNRSPA